MSMEKIIQIFVTNLKTGEKMEISDNLYWFEEEGVRDFSGRGHYEDFKIEVFVNYKKVF